MAAPRTWWIARSEHSVAETVPAPATEVRDFYVDLNNIKTVHPLVVAVDTISRDEASDGYTHTYRVRDRIPMGPFSIGIAYTASVQVPIGGDVVGDVHTEARQFPRVVLRGVVSFEAVGDGTRVTERLTIEAPRPLAAMTVRQALGAHAEMLAGIRRHFE